MSRMRSLQCFVLVESSWQRAWPQLLRVDDSSAAGQGALALCEVTGSSSGAGGGGGGTGGSGEGDGKTTTQNQLWRCGEELLEVTSRGHAFKITLSVRARWGGSMGRTETWTLVCPAKATLMSALLANQMPIVGAPPGGQGGFTGMHITRSRIGGRVEAKVTFRLEPAALVVEAYGEALLYFQIKDLELVGLVVDLDEHEDEGLMLQHSGLPMYHLFTCQQRDVLLEALEERAACLGRSFEPFPTLEESEVPFRWTAVTAANATARGRFQAVRMQVMGLPPHGGREYASGTVQCDLVLTTTSLVELAVDQKIEALRPLSSLFAVVLPPDNKQKQLELQWQSGLSVVYSLTSPAARGELLTLLLDQVSATGVGGVPLLTSSSRLHSLRTTAPLAKAGHEQDVIAAAVSDAYGTLLVSAAVATTSSTPSGSGTGGVPSDTGPAGSSTAIDFGPSSLLEADAREGAGWAGVGTGAGGALVDVSSPAAVGVAGSPTTLIEAVEHFVANVPRQGLRRRLNDDPTEKNLRATVARLAQAFVSVSEYEVNSEETMVAYLQALHLLLACPAVFTQCAQLDRPEGSIAGSAQVPPAPPPSPQEAPRGEASAAVQGGALFHEMLQRLLDTILTAHRHELVGFWAVEVLLALIAFRGNHAKTGSGRNAPRSPSASTAGSSGAGDPDQGARQVHTSDVGSGAAAGGDGSVEVDSDRTAAVAQAERAHRSCLLLGTFQSFGLTAAAAAAAGHGLLVHGESDGSDLVHASGVTLLVVALRRATETSTPAGGVGPTVGGTAPSIVVPGMLRLISTLVKPPPLLATQLASASSLQSLAPSIAAQRYHDRTRAFGGMGGVHAASGESPQRPAGPVLSSTPRPALPSRPSHPSPSSPSPPARLALPPQTPTEARRVLIATLADNDLFLAILSRGIGSWSRRGTWLMKVVMAATDEFMTPAVQTQQQIQQQGEEDTIETSRDGPGTPPGGQSFRTQMQHHALKSGALLRHFVVAVFGKDAARRAANAATDAEGKRGGVDQLSGDCATSVSMGESVSEVATSRFLVAHWTSGSKEAQALLQRMVPPGLMIFLLEEAPVVEEFMAKHRCVDRMWLSAPHDASEFGDTLPELGHDVAGASEQPGPPTAHPEELAADASNVATAPRRAEATAAGPRRGRAVGDPLSERRWSLFFGMLSADLTALHSDGHGEGLETKDVLWRRAGQHELEAAVRAELASIDRARAAGRSVQWNHFEFRVKYESLEDELRVKGLYVGQLLKLSDYEFRTCFEDDVVRETFSHTIFITALLRSV